MQSSFHSSHSPVFRWCPTEASLSQYHVFLTDHQAAVGQVKACDSCRGPREGLPAERRRKVAKEEHTIIAQQPWRTPRAGMAW